jgi:hypothetical protein
VSQTNHKAPRNHVVMSTLPIQETTLAALVKT